MSGEIKKPSARNRPWKWCPRCKEYSCLVTNAKQKMITEEYWETHRYAICRKCQFRPCCHIERTLI